MCGFIGFFSRRARAHAPNFFKPALKAIQHRGPDSSNCWFDPEGHAAFGYVRLGLVGLANGTQPIVADEDDVVLMVNGEFYDYPRIRRELEAQGCRFKTSSDSEIALHLYRLHGVRAIEKLRGEFSILLYDRKRRLMLAARDRVGIKPLYYAEHDGAHYFASEIKALLAAGVTARWDEEAYASRAFVLRDRTVFQGVRSVKPGAWMMVDSAGLQTEQYWDWTFPTREALRADMRSESSMIDTLRGAIEESVRLRLHAEVPVGVSLSGGLDSTGVLGLATKLHGKPLHAFHLSFKGMSGYDERAHAEVAAEHNQAHLHVLSVDSNDLADHFEETLWHCETPFSNAHSIAKYLLCKFVQKEGMRAVLTGEGADEVFGGYPHFRRDMLLHNSEGQDEALVATLRQRLKDGPDRHLRCEGDPTAWVREQMGHGVSWLDSQAALFAPLANLFRSEFAERHAGIDAYRQFFERLSPRALADWDPLNRSIYMVAKSSLPNLVLTTLGDRLEMAGSLEGRPPLLDHRVVELACKLPVWMKVRGATEKYALREALRPYVPAAVLQRRKQYFRAPPSTLDPRSRMYERMRDILASKDLEALPFYDPKKVRAFLEHLGTLPAAQRESADHLLTEIAALCLMHRRFGMASF